MEKSPGKDTCTVTLILQGAELGGWLNQASPALDLEICIETVTFFLFLFSETMPVCTVMAILELAVLTRWASNSQICVPLPPKCSDERHATLWPEEGVEAPGIGITGRCELPFRC